MINLKAVFIAICLLGISLCISAQVAVNTDGSNPAPSAILDAKSTTKGFLPPRMTRVQRDAIQNPDEGLTIYNTDLKCLEFYTGIASGWYCPCSMSIGSIDCASIVVNGNYMVNVPLIASNSVTISVTPTTIGTYNIFSNTVNGFHFSKAGTFSTLGTQTVTLIGGGTPLTAGVTTFTVTYGASSCSFSVTVEVGEIIYYGVSSKTTTTNPPLTAEDVKSFPVYIGKVGGPNPNPRQYTLNATVNEYQYWAIPDLPYGDGSRVVNNLTREGGVSALPLWNTMSGGVKVCQSNPENTAVLCVAATTICYYLMDIDGVSYRIYRTNTKNSYGFILVEMYSIQN